MILRAKYVLNADFRPIDNGFVRIESQRIVTVGTFKGATDEDLVDCGEALLMPGLVNAHTHLELGGLHHLVSPTHDFVAWLRRLAPMMRSMSADHEQIEASTRTGLQRSLEGGTTQVADISRFAAITRKTIAEIDSRPSVTSFGEVLGSSSVNPHELVEQSADLQHRSATLALGISPHATYSVPHETMLKCIDVAAALRAPLCIHAAESLAEEEFLLNGTGPLRDFLESMGACDSSYVPFGVRPIEFLNRSCALKPNTLLAHCNYVNDDEIKLLAEKETSVAYCPRTHYAFGHPPHRFADMLRAGVNVCLGTDSLASNPSLSMLEEIRFLRSHRPDASVETILRMATIGGGKALSGRALGDRALGAKDGAGGLTAGSRADLIAVPIDPTGPTDPLDNILASTHQPAHCVVAGNRMAI
jgi:cytosine/adenosine deaminase-related metal-dependent hydrolase